MFITDSITSKGKEIKMGRKELQSALDMMTWRYNEVRYLCDSYSREIRELQKTIAELEAKLKQKV